MMIRAYHRDRGDVQRDVVLIPASAHGTNPASAAMAGLRWSSCATAAGMSNSMICAQRHSSIAIAWRP